MFLFWDFQWWLIGNWMQLTGQLGNHFIRYWHWGSIWTADVHVWLNPWWIQQLRQWIWMLSRGSGMKLGTTGRGWVVLLLLLLLLLLLFLLFFFFFFFVLFLLFVLILVSFPDVSSMLPSRFPAAIRLAYLYHQLLWIRWYNMFALFSHWLRKTTRPTYRRHLSQALVSLHGGKMRRSWNPHLHLQHCVVSSQWRSLESTAQWTWIISVPSLLPCIKPVAHKFRPTGWLLIDSTHQKQVEESNVSNLQFCSGFICPSPHRQIQSPSIRL